MATILNLLNEITARIRKGNHKLTEEEVWQICDIIRYIPEENRLELYNYLLENEPLLAKKIEKETLAWLTDIFQNISELEPENLYLKPKNIH